MRLRTPKDGNGNSSRSLKCKVLFLVPVFFVVFGIIVLGYFCPLGWYALSPGHELQAQEGLRSFVLQQHSPPVTLLNHIINNKSSKEVDLNVKMDLSIPRASLGDHKFSRNTLVRDFMLDMEREDVIVFLHIQKTGGSMFGQHLIKNLDVGRPCKCRPGRKRCDCVTKLATNWLFSRYSTGWICGLHADWTELNNCVDDAMNKIEGIRRERKYHYITMLRHPVHRYLSEWRHVQRGATWRNTRYHCNGRDATLEEVPFCYDGINWRTVSLDTFLLCPHNMAVNRQARMLANLSKVNCYNSTGMTQEERNNIILNSAKENLMNMSYFGMIEFQLQSQKLFENTFHMNFLEDFVQYNVTRSSKVNITWNQLVNITKLNQIDMLFYDFAKDLFFQRIELLNQKLNKQTSKTVHGNSTVTLNSNVSSGGQYTIPELPAKTKKSSDHILNI